MGWGTLDRVPAWLWEVFQKQVRWGTWLGKLTHSKGGAGRRLNGQQPVHTISRHSSSLDGQYTGWWIGKSASFSNIYCAPRKYIWARLVLNLLCSQGIYFFLFLERYIKRVISSLMHSHIDGVMMPLIDCTAVRRCQEDWSICVLEIALWQAGGFLTITIICFIAKVQLWWNVTWDGGNLCE